MPAPMPIQIRYGPSGLLAQAAAASGGYAGQVEASRYAQTRYAQQEASDRSYLAQMQSQQMQRDQMQYQQEADQQRLELEAQKMQMANRGATPTSNAAYDSSSPLARSIMNMKQGYLESAKSEGVTGDALTMLENAAKDPNVTVDAARQLFQEHGNVARKGTDLAAREANRVAATADKQAIFDELNSQLPEIQRGAFRAQITDGSVSSTQYRMGIATTMQQVEQANQTNRQRQIGGIDDQIETVEGRIKSMEKSDPTLPYATPASLNPTYESPESGKQVHTMEKFWQNAAHGLSLGGYSPSLVTGGGQKGLQDKINYQKELNNLADLQQQRNALANPKEASAVQSAGGSRFQVGQIIPVKGRQFRVTSIAADGVPILDPA